MLKRFKASARLENSALYKGWVRHRRFVPVDHVFKYPLFMLYLDLDELDDFCSAHWFCSKNGFNLVSFHRKDYLDPEEPDLKKAVVSRASQYFQANGLNIPDIASVRMLTHLRYCNMVFNPVTFYYCFDSQGDLLCILAEITNTPWGERHCYVLPVGQSVQELKYSQKGSGHHVYDFEKCFHVSPFNPMSMRYKWAFNNPGSNLRVHMDNHLLADQEKHFDATLVMNELPLSQSLGRTLIRFPFMTVNVVVGIYWQAFKLWVKRSPFYDHPDTNDAGVLSHSKPKS